MRKNIDNNQSEMWLAVCTIFVALLAIGAVIYSYEKIIETKVNRERGISNVRN